MAFADKRTSAALGSVFAGLAVAFGAFGAHALKARLEPADLAIFETAVRYQMYHGLALLVLGLSAWDGSVRLTTPAFTGGILLFSGSLYALVLSGQRWLGAVTPLGGVALIVGWVCLVWQLWKQPWKQR